MQAPQHRRSAVSAAAGFAAWALAGACLAQPAYPTRPIGMIVPFPPGGVVDNAARAIAQTLSPSWGQAIVVENRPGANGNIGVEACAKAEADGYTVCFPAGVIISLNPFAYSRLPFNPQRDLAPVVHVGVLDTSIAVSAGVPVNSVKELVEFGRAKPGALNWASLGTGSSSHLYMEWFQAKTGAKFTHVPYKGSPDMIRALIAGEVHVNTNSPGVLLPHVKAGKVRLLSVVTNGERFAPLPQVPTLREQGYDLDFRNWVAVFLPAKAPEAIIRRWNSEVNRLVKDPAWTARYFQPMALTPTGGTVEEFLAFMKRDLAQSAELVKIAKLRLD
ncbi:MAG: tripartite tricarboxylate transporter substrate binding protein [Burkholderiales bacterium]|nr:tripartite tricarboxylate transporter substrate binding protein [Burkholderiales bacterium]